MKGKARKAAMTGILAAAALVLSLLDSILPVIPMAPPGFKLGLSNIVVMYAAGSLGLPIALFLAVLKGGIAFFTRGIAAGMMSLAGGVCSTLCMWALYRRTGATFALIGVGGALCHNAAQLGVARLFTGTPVLFYVPALLLFSVITGLLTGGVLKQTLPHLLQLEKHLGKPNGRS